ncbi:MAG: carbamoyl-phosphate synthase (glutamine-hydrolyzing) large subunit [archaeon]
MKKVVFGKAFSKKGFFDKTLKKVLLLGSGALKIGEAGEFDFSGSQAIKALKEEGIKVVLINPNIATIQTSENFADKVYFLPLTPFFVEKVIKKEKPDAILLSFGGQTALNCGLELEKKGVLKKFKVKVLGTSIKTIEETEDRKKFTKKLNEIKVKTPESTAVTNISDGIKAAKKIGFPVMLRAGFALGGKGSGIALNAEELRKKLGSAFSFSEQVLIEKSLKGFKEIEYEVVRDKFNNCITVCNMENLDPLGIHTGESIVVAPSQTLTNKEYHLLREISIKTIKHLGIIGECNIQFALNPKKEEVYVIEVNARLSRSSALASKATGYPLAFIAAKLALGYSLTELENSITKKTIACFEPALDYCVVKMPRWDLKKFRNAETKINSQMKSVGEVMAIGRKFEEALQKAVRMADTGFNGLDSGFFRTEKEIKTELAEPSPERIHAVASALEKNFSVEEIHELTKIDKWFLFKIKNIIETEKKLAKQKNGLTKELLLEAKQNGFSDRQIAFLLKTTEEKIREQRKKNKIHPVIKQIDTLAAEYPAKTNYLYLTFNGEKDDVKALEKNIIVLGGGPYRIGSSVEFDWCCVNTLKALRKNGFKTIMINCNPETVSTDYDESDKLFFEELSLETVLEIYGKEKSLGIIISMGGQTPNNLALKLDENKVKILGTKVKSIDLAENRNKFSALIDSLGVNQPEWRELTSLNKASEFAKTVGFPVLVRPSYVLSGSGMAVVFNEKELKGYLEKNRISKEHPTVISKFIINAREIEIDGVAKNGKLIIYAITEHVENAGIHSGDATIVLPAQKIYIETINRIKSITKQIAAKLEITGPFNIQFIAKDNEIKVIECNLRASRSFPFCSKVIGKNFIDYSVKAILGKPIEKTVDYFGKLNYVGVKAPQFSFSRLSGADPISGVEMASTGEVACLGKDLYDAFLKAMLAANNSLPKKNILVSIGGEENKYVLLKPIQKLVKKGFSLFATKNTHRFLKFHGIKSRKLFKVQEKKEPNVLTYLTGKKIDFIINVPDKYHSKEWDPDYSLRRTATDFNVPLITNLELTKLFVKSLAEKNIDELEIKSWDEYLKNGSNGKQVYSAK